MRNKDEVTPQAFMCHVKDLSSKISEDLRIPTILIGRYSTEAVHEGGLTLPIPTVRFK